MRRFRGLAACFAAVCAVFPPSADASLIVPSYSSRPGAFAKIYLDFDGDTTPTWGTFAPGFTPAYSTDADTNNFSDDELENIRQIYLGVAEKYSPFNINVTTVDPGNINNLETAKIVIGGDGPWAPAGVGGIAIFTSFANSGFPNIGFVFPGHLANGTPRYVTEAAAHEAGHGFGLDHQSLWVGSTFVAEYNPGNAQRAPIMGKSYFAERGQWWLGPKPAGASLIQNDLTVLSRTGVTLAPNFGYRPDDHGSTLALADALTIDPEFDLSGFGVIEQITDADWFSFSTPGGTANIIADVAPYAAMLDLSLALYTDSGTLLASSATASLGETINFNLDPGSYRLAVTSAGTYGDIGQYFLSGSVIPEPSGLSVLALTAACLFRRKRR